MNAVNRTQLSSLYHELVDYLVKTATPEQVLAFEESEQAEERTEDLLERNSEDTLTPDEAAELQEILQLDAFMGLLKAQAMLTLKQS